MENPLVLNIFIEKYLFVNYVALTLESIVQ